MSAVFPLAPLSSTPRRVEPCEPMPYSVQRFSRTLDQCRPTERSATAVIVPMADDAPLHPHDRIAAWGSAFGGVAVAVFLLCERFA
ncbi:MAG: hypothetical protein ACRYGA_02140 [Janthinobacterium lividum]